MVATTPETMTDAEQRKTQARELYRANLREGYRMTGAELAGRFDRKERWGQLRIAEVQEAASPSPVATSLPPVTTPPNAEPAPAEPQEREPQRTAPLKTWPVWLLLLPASVAIWSGWVGLGEMAGFGPVNLLPGIADFEINTAITLPIGMEVYAAYALYVWLSGRARGRALAMARTSAIVALTVGALGQVAYHVMAAAGVGVAPWWITAGVACLPVGVVGLGAGLAHMVKAEQLR